jgi:serine/threonine protein kinase
MAGSQVGDRVSEYLLDELVGNGSFGQVFKAHHHIWKDQIVAVKIPTDSQFVTNLRKEGITIHGLKHPNIVGALGLDPYAEVAYLIMEFVDGCSLRELIDAHPQGLPIIAAQNIICGILSALEHSHAHGVVHRDVKPANVLIAHGGRKPAEEVQIADVKVTDFGLGMAGQITTNSIMQSGSLTSEDGHSISGTLAYMSPEQRDGAATDGRSDLYSAGILLFEMLCGERPSGSDMPSQVRDDLPSWVNGVYARLYTRLERRFPSAADALREIQMTSIPPISVGAPPRVPPIGIAPLMGLMGRTTHPTRSAGPSQCPACQAPVEPGENFCILCGHQVASSPRQCTHCRGYPAPDDRFCIFCGTPLPQGVG